MTRLLIIILFVLWCNLQCTATNYLTLGVYVVTNTSESTGCDLNNVANVMIATEYCTYDALSGMSTKLKSDCNTIEYYSNKDCSGTPSSEEYLNYYDPNETCFNYNIQDDDNLEGMDISYSITCSADPDYLTWPGYVQFDGNSTDSDTCSNSVSSLSAQIFALNSECTGLTLTVDGFSVEVSAQAMIVDNQLVQRYYYMNSLCEGEGVDEIIIYQINTCEDESILYSPSLKSGLNKHLSSLKNSIVNTISNNVLKHSAIKSTVVGNQLYYPTGYAYGSSQVGLIPYVENVIEETNGYNPASVDTNRSETTTLGAGGIIGIIVSILVVATLVSYVIYSRRKSRKAAGQLGLALQEV